MTDKTRRKKAVEIAKDVLKWLRTKRLEVSTGTYCKFTANTVQDFSGSLKKALPKLVTARTPCEVCAKGALFIAAVDLFNKIDVPEFGAGYDDGHSTVEPLLPYFSQATLDRVEQAFEVTVGWKAWDYDDAIEFGRQYDDPRERLRAIMKNIIKNNGDFIPVVEKGV